MLTVDLNADAGESAGAGADEPLLSVVTSVSIACGVHAGSAETIARLSALAHARGVGVGAHPGLPDGRRARPVAPAEAREAVRSQVAAFLEASRAPLQHLKLHGALYHAARDPEVARAVAEAARAAGVPLIIAQAGSPLERIAGEAGIEVAAEAFLDRAYEPGGTLVPRERPGALIVSPEEAAARAVELALHGRVRAVDGTAVAVRARTFCVHGDTEGARELLRSARQALERAGVALRALGAR